MNTPKEVRSNDATVSRSAGAAPGGSERRPGAGSTGVFQWLWRVGFPVGRPDGRATQPRVFVRRRRRAAIDEYGPGLLVTFALAYLDKRGAARSAQPGRPVGALVWSRHGSAGPQAVRVRRHWGSTPDPGGFGAVRLSPYLTRVASCESHFRPDVIYGPTVGKLGEKGLFQLAPFGLLPMFFARGFTNPWNPWQQAAFATWAFAHGLGGRWSCA